MLLNSTEHRSENRSKTKIKLRGFKITLGSVLFLFYSLKLTEYSLATEVSASKNQHQASPSPVFSHFSKVQNVQNVPTPSYHQQSHPHFYQYPISASPKVKNQRPLKTSSSAANEEYQNPYPYYYYNHQYQYQNPQQQQQQQQKQYQHQNSKNHYNRGYKPVPKIQRRQENSEQEDGDSIDKFWELLGPLVFPLPFLLGALPFAIPVIPLALMTRLNDTFAEG